MANQMVGKGINDIFRVVPKYHLDMYLKYSLQRRGNFLGIKFWYEVDMYDRKCDAIDIARLLNEQIEL